MVDPTRGVPRVHARISVLIPLLTMVCISACGAGGAPALPGPVAALPKIATTIATSAATAQTQVPSLSATPSGATATPTPNGEPAAVDASLDGASALALGGGTAVRSAPSMTDGKTVRTLADRQPLKIIREVRGQRWVVGDQTWAMAIQDWTNVWYQIDGGYVYAGFVYVPRPGELDAIQDRSGAHWVDVDLNAQTATAMIGDRSVHVAAATTGKPGFATPGGDHSVQYRKFNETMTSTQAAIQDPNEQYNVQNVLYTQYFDGDGDALHLNYWQPDIVFGHQRTSHGCVGLELHDAQFFWLFASSGSRVNVHPVASSTATPSATSSSTPSATVAAASASSTPTATAAAHATVSSRDPAQNQPFSGTSAPQPDLPPLPPPPVFPGQSAAR